MAMELFTQF